MRSIGVLLGAAIAVQACGGGGDGSRPEPALASSRGAQKAFAPVMRRWQHGTRAERVALEGELSDLSRRFAGEDVSRWSDALLACIALERGQIERADRLAARVIARGPGVTADLGLVVEGAVRRRRGRPSEALARLSPLVGKLIDGYARRLLDEEVVAAAAESGQWRDTLRYARIWLHEADAAEQDAAAERLEVLLQRVPPAELANALSRPPAATVEPPRFREIVAKRLRRATIERRDEALATLLMKHAPSLLGDDYDAIAELASGVRTARVAPRTLGLMLSVRDDATRRISAELGLGAAFALGMPSRVRLVSRDDGGSAEGLAHGLADLVAEGAAIVLLWSDLPGSTAASAFAAANQIPIVLLGTAAPTGATDQVFSVAEDRSQTLATLEKIIQDRSVGQPVIVGMDQTVDETTTCVLPSRTRGVVVMGTPWCSRALLAAAPTGVSWAFALSAWAPELPRSAAFASAGAFPIDARSTTSEIGRWIARHGSPPTWFAALGHDSAILGAQAVQQLSEVETEDPNEVTRRRRQATDALARGSGELWTTEATGFGGARVLPRRITVRRMD